MKDYDKEFEDIIENGFGKDALKKTEPKNDRVLRGVIRWINYDDIGAGPDSLSDKELDFFTDEKNLISYLMNEYQIDEEEAARICREVENELYPPAHEVD